MVFVDLNNGLKMPIIGLGTYPLNRFDLINAMRYAYQAGCTSFDTSAAYENERWLGLGVKVLKLFGSESLFITTKLSNFDQRKGNVRKALLGSMSRLGVKYLDLYLMHWPNPKTYLDSWKQMEDLYEEGLVGAIGVCNFHEHHLINLLDLAKYKPVINQIELHPLLTQVPLRELCRKEGIKIQSYSPVARMDKKLIENQILIDLSCKYNKTVPQIILRWNIQNGLLVIPKSGNKDRIRENFDVFDFELQDEDIKKVDGLNEDYRVRYNPDTVDYTMV